MDNPRRLLGVVKIAVTERPDWRPTGLTTSGRISITCEDVDADVAEITLMAWAHGALAGKVLPAPVSEDDLRKRVASFHWPSVFKPGDVIRSRGGRTIGVVITVGNYGPDDDPRYELHVEAAVDGVRDGVGLWDPWEAVIDNDPESVAEAQRLGLS